MSLTDTDGKGGRLVLVATPIGNLGDLSPRAVATLRDADVIACEDTRVSRKLLTHAGVSRPRLVTLNEHSEESIGARLVDEAAAGAVVAVVTDAGLPGISDPGQRLVALAAAAGVAVEVVPGPSAAVAALVASGLPTSRFCFEGFLPRKGRARRERLAALAVEERTTVLFESPHRVRELLADLAEACGDERPVAVARELTKLHEEIWRGDLAGAMVWAAAALPRGEYALVLGGAPVVVPDEATIAAAVEAGLRRRQAEGLDRRSAVEAVATALGISKRLVYDAALRLDGWPAST